MSTSYISEYTKFINDFLALHPAIVEDQLRSRGYLWDVELNKEEQAGFQAGNLPAKAYPY